MARTRRRTPADRAAGRRPGVRSRRAPAGARVRSSRGRRPAEARERTGTRPSRSKALRRRWIAVLSVLTVLGLGYVLLFTSLLGVRAVEVYGTGNLTAEQVRQAADVPDSRAMLRLDTGEIAGRVLRLPGVAEVDVSRSWPATIEITVTERTAVGFFDTGEELRLVDGEGVVFRKVAEPPPDLPELKLARVAPDDPVTRAVTTVLGQLPRQLAERVVSVRAGSPASVELTLADGKIIRWGDAEQPERKAKVLAALMTREGTTYDVSSPELPTIS
ncbi:cell division protein FtsQ/DivIB [Amycolatopsis aidingensis]|uniref:cell division protein FtsQ/DivIB n=1 Tax=Amycolatopsis aidingensis TaxID=2842453 RepID=UPI001C0BB93F|nr:FtsQ-type POTRA domain-containing protein [Amycolatopsis aidingensis]